MSTKYKDGDHVPTEVLCNRIEEIVKHITDPGLRPYLLNQFDMRIPAELDRDADLVLSTVARRLQETEKERDQWHEDFNTRSSLWREEKTRANKLEKERDQLNEELETEREVSSNQIFHLTAANAQWEKENKQLKLKLQAAKTINIDMVGKENYYNDKFVHDAINCKMEVSQFIQLTITRYQHLFQQHMDLVSIKPTPVIIEAASSIFNKSDYMLVSDKMPQETCDCQLITISTDGQLTENAAHYDGEQFYVMSFMFDPPEIMPPSVYNSQPYAWKPLDKFDNTSKKVGE